MPKGEMLMIGGMKDLDKIRLVRDMPTEGAFCCIWKSNGDLYCNEYRWEDGHIQHYDCVEEGDWTDGSPPHELNTNFIYYIVENK